MTVFSGSFWSAATTPGYLALKVGVVSGPQVNSAIPERDRTVAVQLELVQPLLTRKERIRPQVVPLRKWLLFCYLFAP